jgi:tyrosine phenol-lyase
VWAVIVVRSSRGGVLRVDGFRIRVVERLALPSIWARLKAIRGAGWNTFLLRADDVFLDMLTDSGVNAMSDRQLAAMITAQDAYAGGRSYYELVDAVREVFGMDYVLPVHQGRAAEHLLAKVFVRPGMVVITNYHFTTSKAHVELAGGEMIEIPVPQALDTTSDYPFKGDMDVGRLEELLSSMRGRVAYVRLEAVANLLGGQPVSMRNVRLVRELCDKFNVPLVLDASMIDWNAYFIKEREPGYASKSLAEIVREMAGYADIIYMSARKAPAVRGGLIATNKREYYDKLVVLLPVYEGFPSYGGMSVKELAAMAVGLKEMVDESLVGSELELIRYVVEELDKRRVPVVRPPGGLGVHLDAARFLEHLPRNLYPAASLTGALYLASGVRAMERGTMSMDRARDGREVYADLELVRIAFPRRTYTRSHAEYLVDRILWLYENRDAVKGLRWVYEPPVLRFFLGRLEDIGGWGEELARRYERDLGEY